MQAPKHQLRSGSNWEQIRDIYGNSPYYEGEDGLLHMVTDHKPARDVEYWESFAWTLHPDGHWYAVHIDTNYTVWKTPDAKPPTKQDIQKAHLNWLQLATTLETA